MKDKSLDESSNTSIETGSVATNKSDADFFLKEANQSFQSMGSVFAWLGEKLKDVKPTQEEASLPQSVSTESLPKSELTMSVAESYASMVQSYTTLIVEAKSTRDKEKIKEEVDNLKTLLGKLKIKDPLRDSVSFPDMTNVNGANADITSFKSSIRSINTTIASVNSTIQTSIDKLSEDEADDFTRPSSLAVSVKTQLSKKEFMEGLLLPLMRPKLQHIRVLMEEMDSSIDTVDESNKKRTLIENFEKSKELLQSSLIRPAPTGEDGSMQSSSTGSSIDSQPIHKLLFELERQRNQLLKRLLAKSSLSASLSASDSANSQASSIETSPISSQLLVFKKDGITSLDSISSDATYTPSAPNIRFHKNLRKAVAVAASIIIDVNNIFISIGQHIIGEDDTLGGAIFFKLDKDGTVLEQLHSAIFKDSNEYDKFVTLAGGDRNKLWEGTKDDLIGQIQLANIPHEVAKLRNAVRKTQKNTAATPAPTTTATPTASAGGGNNTTKKYYKRATRSKRPRRLGRRTR